jgi:hypothetical protein
MAGTMIDAPRLKDAKRISGTINAQGRKFFIDYKVSGGGHSCSGGRDDVP